MPGFVDFHFLRFTCCGKEFIRAFERDVKFVIAKLKEYKCGDTSGIWTMGLISDIWRIKVSRDLPSSLGRYMFFIPWHTSLGEYIFYENKDLVSSHPQGTTCFIINRVWPVAMQLVGEKYREIPA